MKLLLENESTRFLPVYFYNMDTNINTTGKRIKYLRETVNNWSGVKFREEVLRRYAEKIEPSTLTNHEKDTSMPLYSTLINYAKTLGTTTDFLLLVTDDPAQNHKTDRNVVIEAKGEEERRILEETSSLLEEMPAGDLRFVLDIIRRISAVTGAPVAKPADPDIESLIEVVLNAIEQAAGTPVRDKAIDEMERSLSSTPPLRAMWRRIRTKRKD